MSRFGQIPMAALLDKRLTPRDITVIAALGTYTDKHGWCYPSYSNVGKMLGVSRQAVQRSVANLERAGYIERQGRINDSNQSQTSNLTRVKFDFMPPESEQREAEKRSSKKMVAKAQTPQPDVAPPQPDVAPPATSEVAPPATPALHELPQVNSPSEEEVSQELTLLPCQSDSGSPEDQESYVQLKRKPKSAGAPKKEPASRATWAAYAAAYVNRYGVEPVRNSRVNGQMAQFVKRVGQAEAPAVAAFYVSHNGRYYVQRGHDTNALLRDAEKLRMEWASGRHVTSVSARQADRKQHHATVYETLSREIANGQL